MHQCASLIMLPPPSPSFFQICLTTPSTAAICQMSAVKAAFFCLTSKQLSPKYCTETSTDSLLSGVVTIIQLEENSKVKTAYFIIFNNFTANHTIFPCPFTLNGKLFAPLYPFLTATRIPYVQMLMSATMWSKLV